MSTATITFTTHSIGVIDNWFSMADTMDAKTYEELREVLPQLN